MSRINRGIAMVNSVLCSKKLKSAKNIVITYLKDNLYSNEKKKHFENTDKVLIKNMIQINVTKRKPNLPFDSSCSLVKLLG